MKTFYVLGLKLSQLAKINLIIAFSLSAPIINQYTCIGWILFSIPENLKSVTISTGYRLWKMDPQKASNTFPSLRISFIILFTFFNTETF